MMALGITLAVHWLTALVFIVLFVRSMSRTRDKFAERLERIEAEGAARLAALEAEVAAARAALPPDLLVELELSDENPVPDFDAACKQSAPLVRALSLQEEQMGGAGLLLTGALAKPGAAVRLTLSPVERVGAAERVRRVAEEWNARGGPLPPGVTAARAAVSVA